MKMAAILFGAALSTTAGFAVAQDAMKKDAMKDGAMSKDMTMAQCKDHMAMQKKEMKKDDASMKMDAMCADMMKKDAMKKDDAMMKKDGMASDPMKK
jgi:rRNA pseudouridine-1189 N-methylase Emg1 (Nep1/Mra1 family)